MSTCRTESLKSGIAAIAMSARSLTCIEDSITDTTVTASSKVTVSLNINRAWAIKNKGMPVLTKSKSNFWGFFTRRNKIFLQISSARKHSCITKINTIILISISTETGRISFYSEQWGVIFKLQLQWQNKDYSFNCLKFCS